MRLARRADAGRARLRRIHLRQLLGSAPAPFRRRAAPRQVHRRPVRPRDRRAQVYDAERVARARAEALEREAQLATARVSRLQDFTAALSSAATMKDVARVLFEQGLEQLGAKALGIVWMMRPGELQLVFGHGVSEPEFRFLDAAARAGKRLPIRDAILGRRAVWLESPDEIEGPVSCAGAAPGAARRVRLRCRAAGRGRPLPRRDRVHVRSRPPPLFRRAHLRRDPGAAQRASLPPSAALRGGAGGAWRGGAHRPPPGAAHGGRGPRPAHPAVGDPHGGGSCWRAARSRRHRPRPSPASATAPNA